jgi:hypothetical protein
MDLARDQAIRSEVYDAIPGVLATREILVSPTLAAMPVDNATDGDTKGSTSSRRLRVWSDAATERRLSHCAERPLANEAA